MSKSDLKAAMQSLQVNKPLKLAGSLPQFRVPTPIAEATRVPVETKVSTPTTVATQTLVDSDTKVTVATKAPAETMVPAATYVDGEVNSVSDQDSSVVLEEKSVSKLHQGYTRLPNGLLMRMAAGDLHRSEMQILLLIARFTISFQRRYAPLSKAVLERQSGLGGPAVLQAIAKLQAKGLIQKIPGDQYRPNQLGLVFEDEFDFFTHSKNSTLVAREIQVPVKTKVSPTTMVPEATVVDVGTNPLVAAQTPGEVSVATYFKDTKTIKNNNSLSALPEVLQKYFAELKPAKKRESESKAFEELSLDYSAQDISDCFSLVRSRGVGSESEHCHSPMAFLSKAMNGVLVEVEDRRKKLCERSEREGRETEGKRKQAELEAREAADWKMKEKAFLAAFPGDEQQREIITELAHQLPFRPNTQAGRVLAIGSWWDGLKEHERKKFSE